MLEATSASHCIDCGVATQGGADFCPSCTLQLLKGDAAAANDPWTDEPTYEPTSDEEASAPWIEPADLLGEVALGEESGVTGGAPPRAPSSPMPAVSGRSSPASAVLARVAALPSQATAADRLAYQLTDGARSVGDILRAGKQRGFELASALLFLLNRGCVAVKP